MVFYDKPYKHLLIICSKSGTALPVPLSAVAIRSHSQYDPFCKSGKVSLTTINITDLYGESVLSGDILPSRMKKKMTVHCL